MFSSCQKEILERVSVVQAECACETPIEQDKLAAVPTAIIGSSTVYLWNNVENTFGIPVKKFGYSGYGILDISNRLTSYVSSLKSSQIIIYVGDNDFTWLGDAEIIRRYKLMVDRAIAQNPQAYIIFISIKPSWTPSLNARHKYVNGVIGQYVSSKRNTKFLDVYSKMVLASGAPNPTYFVSKTNIHLSATGYALWKSLLMDCMLREN